MILNYIRNFNQPSRIRIIDKNVFLGISFCLTAYLVARAILVPMAHDEIATFYYFVQSGNVSPFLSNIDTNNHFLNSLLTWVFYHLFGSSPLALRLSNLVFIPVFFFFLFKISQHLKARIFRYAFFLTMAFTLHFIEFLALSRGYGMSMALLMGSLFFLIEGIEKKNLQSYAYSLIFIFIASTANLALINTYALILLFISTSLIINNFKRIKLVIVLLFFAGILPLSLIILQIIYIKINAGLIAGSPHNFWATTITTLFAYLFETSHFYANIIAATLFASIAVAGSIAIYKLRKLSIILKSKPIVFLYLLAGSIFSILILGVFFKVNYPDDRIGIYLYPLALGSLLFLLDEIIINKNWIRIVSVLFLVVPAHFFIYLNTTYSIWYKYDVIPVRFYEQVMRNHKPGTVPPTIAGHGLRIFCWSYLDYRHGGVASQFFFTNFPDYNADFQIVNIKMIPGWQQYYDTIDYDPVSERHLLKLRKPHKENQLILHKIPSIRKCNSEFLAIAEGCPDSLINKNLRFDLNFSIHSVKKPFNCRIVLDMCDNKKQNVRYEYIQLNWLRNIWNGAPHNFSNCILVYKVPPEAAEYTVYLWNIDKTEFDIGEGTVTVNELK